MSKTKPGILPKITKHLAPIIIPYRFLMAGCLALSILDVLISLSEAYLTKGLVDTALKNHSSELASYIWQMIGIIILGIIVTYLFKYSYGYFSSTVLLKMRRQIMEHVQQLPVSYMEKQHSGDLISRVSGDLVIVQNFVGTDLLSLFTQLLTFIAAAVYMVIMSWKLFIASMILTPFALAASFSINKPAQDYNFWGQEAVGKATSVLQDTIGGIYMIKAFNIGDLMAAKYREQAAIATDWAIKKWTLLVWTSPLTVILRMMPTVLCFAYGGYLAFHGQITSGQVVAFSFLIGIITWPLVFFPDLVNGVRTALSSAERLLEVLDQPRERASGQSFVLKSSELVTFEGVTFTYNDQINVLNDLNFRLTAGQKVALVGASGSGKSTIFKLLCGSYETTAGRIKVYGHDLRDWNLSVLRSQIALVSQDTFLFPSSVYQNILYGRPDATYEEVIKAAQAANAHQFIQELTEGYDTLVGERGIKLSGGQKQRLAIARAILKDAPLLLLDEPTSALDTHSENLVQEALHRIMKGRTVLIVAHRLSTIKNVDQILVLDNGTIAERGTHEQLLELNGIYSRLYLRQFVTNEESSAV